jgi:alpha,alpha-trehalose phosphorylase
MAAEVGHLRLAYDYLGEAALMDLHDLEHNTRDGLHIASLAGTWMALVAGFGGMRYHEGGLCFSPKLPEKLARLAFSVQVLRRRLRVEITDLTATYTLVEGAPLEIQHYGQPITVSDKSPQTRDVPEQTARPEPRQPPGRRPDRRA